MLLHMRRKQLLLDEELDEMLKDVAARTGRSESDHVRSALRSYLSQEVDADQGVDLADFAGVIDDDAPADLASELDHYAYGTPKGHKQRAS